MNKKLVPEKFDVPKKLESASFLLRPLMMSDVNKDFDAVMSSIEHLHQQIPFQVFDALWPSPTMTLEEDLADLGWHQVEFKNRSSFTYTVMNLEETQCLGCVYIFPPRFTDADAEIFLWVRKSEYDRGLDSELFETVKQWIANKWPFKTVAYPFRK